MFSVEHWPQNTFGGGTFKYGFQKKKKKKMQCVKATQLTFWHDGEKSVKLWVVNEPSAKGI